MTDDDFAPMPGSGERIGFRPINLGPFTVACPRCGNKTHTLPMATHVYTDEDEDPIDSMLFLGAIFFPCGHLHINEELSNPVTTILNKFENHALSTADLDSLVKVLEDN